jgi:hypothetical protein
MSSHVAVVRLSVIAFPAHCGIPCNDKADLLAKDGSQQQQESPSTSYNEAKMLLKQVHRKTWQRKKGDNGRNTLLHLSRRGDYHLPPTYRPLQTEGTS